MEVGKNTEKRGAEEMGKKSGGKEKRDEGWRT